MNSEQKLTWLTSFSHFITHGYMSLLPALLVVIATEHALSFLHLGVIAAIGYFLYGLGSFPSGWLADKFGSKRMLTVGAFGMAGSSILVGLSPSTITFGIAYALLGCFASIHHPAGLSLIARRIIEKKGKALGLHGVLGNVGLFLTPLAAGLCILFFGNWRAAYILYGCIGVVFAFILHRASITEEPDLEFSKLLSRPTKLFSTKDDTEHPPEPITQDSESPAEVVIPAALLLLYAGSILSGFIFRGSLTFFPALCQQEIAFVAGHDEPVVVAGFVTTAVLSLGLIGSWFGGYINDKIKRPEIIPVVLFAVVGPALYGLSQLADNRLIAAGVVFSLFYYAWQPSHNYLIARYTRKASHGIGFGVNFFLIFGIGSIATALGGDMVDDYGVDRFYLVLAGIAVAAMVVAVSVVLLRKYQFRFTWRLVKEE
jgi:MFS family permease